MVDSFLRESALEKPQTLDRLNELFHVWLTECYQTKPHSGLEGISPETAYRSDSKALKFLAPEVITSAFLHCEERKVDKAGCISFEGKKYEVGLRLIGCKVNVIYDPVDTTELIIEYEGHATIKAKQLVIGAPYRLAVTSSFSEATLGRFRFHMKNPTNISNAVLAIAG